MSFEPNTPFTEADYEVISGNEPPKNRPDLKTILKHLGLFVLTFISVSVIGAVFVGFGGEPIFIGPIGLPAGEDLYRGMLFACLLLSFLTFHEFGHYFAAVYHNIKVSLPYYIPLPVGIGTLGAVIRIKEKIHQTKQLFDVGVAGPVAGFIVALIVLLIGFATLPEPSHVQNFAGHEELKAYVEMYGEFPDYQTDAGTGNTLVVGETILYSFIASFFDNVPPMWEMYHYPFLFAGWLGLFFTALNLMPVGQLDGGHIMYSLLGYKKHRDFARVFYAFVSILAGIEVVPFLHDLLREYDTDFGALSWIIWGIILFNLMSIAYKGAMNWIYIMLPASLISAGIYIYVIIGPENLVQNIMWAFWILFITFLVKVDHPPVTFYKPLSTGRKVLGWVSMLIFILCISLNPLSLQ